MSPRGKEHLHPTQTPGNSQMTQTLQMLSPLSHLITPSRLSVPNSKSLSCPQKCLHLTSDVCATARMECAVSRTKVTVPIQRKGCEEQNNNEAQFTALRTALSVRILNAWGI